MQYELVKVIDRKVLLDTIQLRHNYSTPDGRGLPRGIHVVLRPADSVRGAYGAELRYHGPFASWRSAGDFARNAQSAANPEPAGRLAWPQYLSAGT